MDLKINKFINFYRVDENKSNIFECMLEKLIKNVSKRGIDLVEDSVRSPVYRLTFDTIVRAIKPNI